MSVRPSAKLDYTKTNERIKIIAFGLFCVKSVYVESIPPISTPNEIFTDFAISQDPIDEIDTVFLCFKDMD